MAGREHFLPGSDVLPTGPDISAQSRQAENSDTGFGSILCGSFAVFLHHNGIGSGGHFCAGKNPGCCSRLQRLRD